jgi:hypothetical protein
MSAYNKKDMSLLQEAYAVQLLREQITYITLGDLKDRLPMMTESELKFINNGLEHILEFWGGLKSLAGSAAKGISNTVTGAANTAKSLGRGALAAGKQVVSNVGDIYKSGEKTSAIGNASTKAQELIDELMQLVSKYEPETTQDQLMGLTLQQIIDTLAQSTAETKANTPTFTQGTGKAAAQAYRGSSTTPPPLPAATPPLPA